MKPQIKALYIAVKDMQRAIRFYEEIFDTKVSSLDDRMSSFDFGHLSFLLFNPTIDSETVTMGNNVVPNIEVGDANRMFELVKAKGCKIIMPPEAIDKYLIFQAEDTEGNVIEFYQNNAP